jgi:glutamyl-tRNA synthetase
VNNAGGVFSYDKLKWMNGVYNRKLAVQDLEARLRPFLAAAGLAVDEEKLIRIIPHIQTRLELLPDAIPLIDFLFRDHIELDTGAFLMKGMDASKATEFCVAAAENLGGLSAFVAGSIVAALRQVAEESGAKSGPVFTVIRIAVTGKTVTPPLFESIFALGQAQSVERLKETAALLASIPAPSNQ